MNRRRLRHREARAAGSGVPARDGAWLIILGLAATGPAPSTGPPGWLPFRAQQIRTGSEQRPRDTAGLTSAIDRNVVCDVSVSWRHGRGKPTPCSVLNVRWFEATVCAAW